MAGKYHSVEMEGDAGLSAAFVVRCIGNDTIRKVDKNNHMELTPRQFRHTKLNLYKSHEVKRSQRSA